MRFAMDAKGWVIRTFDDSFDQIQEEHKGDGAGDYPVVLPC
jgi:hypothetical protein